MLISVALIHPGFLKHIICACRSSDIRVVWPAQRNLPCFISSSVKHSIYINLHDVWAKILKLRIKTNLNAVNIFSLIYSFFCHWKAKTGALTSEPYKCLCGDALFSLQKFNTGETKMTKQSCRFSEWIFDFLSLWLQVLKQLFRINTMSIEIIWRKHFVPISRKLGALF